MQRRLLEKADHGADALRQYIWITRSLYNLDMRETVAWIAKFRADKAN